MKYSSTFTALMRGEREGEVGSYLAGDQGNKERRKDFYPLMATVAPAAPTKENGMGIDLGSTDERGREPTKSFS